MSAGTGVRHSEFNASQGEPVHLLQIWIMPEKTGIQPSYEQKPVADASGKLQLMAAKNASNGAATINQDAQVYVAKLAPGESVEHSLRTGRGAYVQVARGSLSVNGTKLQQGDGAAVEQESKLRISNDGAEQSELLLFDLA
jgi:hypothetical protein